jgi:hypothetical protein
MAQTKNAPAAAPAKPSTLRSLLGYAVGAALGLALLLVLQRMLTTPPPRVIDELPHLAILAEFDDLKRPEVRQQLCALHRELVQLELTVQGPLNFPIVVPREGGAALTDLDKLSVEQMSQAVAYFGIGGYLVPRVLAPDGRSAIVRAAPTARGLGFLPGTRARIEALLTAGRFPDLKLSAYSHALRLDEPETRARINATFGVQTAIVEARSEDRAALTPAFQRDLLRVAERLKGDPRVRAVTVDGAFIHYAAAVEAQNEKLGVDMISGQTWERLQQDARRANIPRTTSTDGAVTFIDAATDQESTGNRELCYALATMANNPRLKGVAFNVRRVRR